MASNRAHQPAPTLFDVAGAPALPPFVRMYEALVARDASWVGVFVACVRTTGIFCLPTCRARKPRPENVTFVATPAEALRAGYRPCRVCRPTTPEGDAPEWLAPLLARVEGAPDVRVTDADLRAMGLDPDTVRRHFQRRHGVTFQGWQRAWRRDRARFLANWPETSVLYRWLDEHLA